DGADLQRLPPGNRVEGADLAGEHLLHGALRLRGEKLLDDHAGRVLQLEDIGRAAIAVPGVHLDRHTVDRVGEHVFGAHELPAHLARGGELTARSPPSLRRRPGSQLAAWSVHLARPWVSRL